MHTERFTRALGALTLLVATASLAHGQSTLASRVAAVRDGTVEFTYATRPDVCIGGDYRDGGSRIDGVMVSRNRSRGSFSAVSSCLRGPARVTVGRARGETVSIRVRVAPGRGAAAADPAVAGDASRIGSVSTGDAAHWLLDAARGGAGESARQALMGAVIADSVPLWRDLAPLIRDGAAPRSLRESAMIWLGSYDDDEAWTTLRTLVADTTLPGEVRAAGIIGLDRDVGGATLAFLEQQYRDGPEAVRNAVYIAVSGRAGEEGARWLAGLAADTSRGEHEREQALFWLGQSRESTSTLVALYPRLGAAALRRHFTFVMSQRPDDAAITKLIDIAEHDADASVRKQALFWLGQTRNPRAIDYIRTLVLR